MSGRESMGDQVVRLIEGWVSSTPPNVVELSVVLDHAKESVSVEVAPLGNPSASIATIEVPPGRFTVTAGSWFRDSPDPQSAALAVEYCRAIAAGGLEEVEFRRGDRVVARQATLHLERRGVRSLEITDSSAGMLPTALAAPILRLGAQRRRIAYAAYYELLPAMRTDGTVAIRPPILGIEEGYSHVSAFPTRGAAESGLEMNDVCDGPITLYDSAGRLLALECHRNNWLVAAAEEDPGHRDQVHLGLSSYLSRPEISSLLREGGLGKSSELGMLGVEDLARLALRVQGLWQ